MKKLLLIDDNPNFIKVMQQRLEHEGYTTLSAADGKEGLQQIQTDKVDLIILDVLMPNMDGYTFIKKLKTQADMKNIPVIVVTAKGDIRPLFKKENVAAFFQKPFNATELLKEIKRILGE